MILLSRSLPVTVFFRSPIIQPCLPCLTFLLFLVAPPAWAFRTVGIYAVLDQYDIYEARFRTIGVMDNGLVLLGAQSQAVVFVMDFSTSQPQRLHVLQDDIRYPIDIQTLGDRFYVLWGNTRYFEFSGIYFDGFNLRGYLLADGGVSPPVPSQYVMQAKNFIVQNGELICSRGYPVPLNPETLNFLDPSKPGYFPSPSFSNYIKKMCMSNNTVFGWFDNVFMTFYTHTTPSQMDELCGVLYPPFFIFDLAGVAIEPNFVLFANRSSDSPLIQITNPCDNPAGWTKVKDYPDLRSVVFINGSRLYAYDEWYVDMYDISDVMNPALMDTWDLRAKWSRPGYGVEITDVESHGDRVYVVHTIPPPMANPQSPDRTRLTILEPGADPFDGNLWQAH